MPFKFIYVNEQANIMGSPDDPENKLSDRIGETFQESYPKLVWTGFPQNLYEALINNERKTFQHFGLFAIYLFSEIIPV